MKNMQSNPHKHARGERYIEVKIGIWIFGYMDYGV